MDMEAVSSGRKSRKVRRDQKALFGVLECYLTEGGADAVGIKELTVAVAVAACTFTAMANTIAKTNAMRSSIKASFGSWFLTDRTGLEPALSNHSQHHRVRNTRSAGTA
jgi:hypothetical protein